MSESREISREEFRLTVVRLSGGDSAPYEARIEKEYPDGREISVSGGGDTEKGAITRAAGILGQREALLSQSVQEYPGYEATHNPVGK